jgi:hypothetical protein
MITRLVILCVLLVSLRSQIALAQVALTAPMPSKLETLEATYLANLRKLHAPVLLDYQRQLELLRQQLTARGRLEDIRAIDVELEQVKRLSASTGILPYTALLPPPPAPPLVPETPPGEPPPRPLRVAATLTLQANESINPTSAKVLPLGKIEWKVPSLPAGRYDVVMVYSAPILLQPESVTATIGGQQITTSLNQDRITKSAENMAVFRLGTVSLERDILSEPFVLQAASLSPLINVRSVSFVKPRPPKKDV